MANYKIENVDIYNNHNDVYIIPDYIYDVLKNINDRQSSENNTKYIFKNRIISETDEKYDSIYPSTTPSYICFESNPNSQCDITLWTYDDGHIHINDGCYPMVIRYVFELLGIQEACMEGHFDMTRGPITLNDILEITKYYDSSSITGPKSYSDLLDDYCTNLKLLSDGIIEEGERYIH